jgi:hypothetical protein
VLAFAPNTRDVRLGESFVLTYKFKDVVSATLSPTGTTLNLNLDKIEIRPERVGTLEYEVAALNADGKVARKSFTVNVTDPSKATIVSFNATPLRLPDGGGTVTVSWQAANATRVEIWLGTDERSRQTVESVGTTVYSLSAKTTIRLVAYDAAGKPVRKALTVQIEPKPEPPTEEPSIPPIDDKVPPIEGEKSTGGG